MNKQAPDFTYTKDAPFIRLMCSGEAQAVAVWNDVAGTFEGGVIPDGPAWRSVLRQIKDAGYSVRAAKKGTAKLTKADRELLAELEG